MNNKQVDTQQALENLVVVYPQINIWGAQTTLTAADIKLGAGGEVPPAKLARLGQKYVVNPDLVKGFYAIRTRVRRILTEIGVGFLGGYAVPLSDKDKVRKALSECQLEFVQLKHHFLADYEAAVKQWVFDNPGYETAIQNGAPAKADVDGHFGFSFDLVQIGPCQGEPADALSHQVQGLSDKLIEEVTEAAEKLYSSRIAGRHDCPIGTKKTLQNMRDKLDGLAFMNPDFTSLVVLLDDAIGCYANSKDRAVQVPEFHQLAAAVLILSEKTKMLQYLEGSRSVAQTVAEKFSPPSPQSVESVVVESGPESDTTQVMPLGSSAVGVEVQDFYF